jgi:hypothetical protein
LARQLRTIIQKTEVLEFHKEDEREKVRNHPYIFNHFFCLDLGHFKRELEIGSQKKSIERLSVPGACSAAEINLYLH